MKIWMKSMRNLLVLIYDEGRFAGLVQEAFIDPKTKRMLGFRVKDHVAHANANRWLSVENVKKTGEDVIFISKDEVLEEKEPEGVSVKEFEGRSVSTQDGRNLGKLDDLEFDAREWTITSIGLQGKQFVEIESGRTVFGEDVILAQKEAEAKQVDNPNLARNVLAAIFGRDIFTKTEDAVKSGYESVKNTLAGNDASGDRGKDTIKTGPKDQKSVAPKSKDQPAEDAEKRNEIQEKPEKTTPKEK